MKATLEIPNQTFRNAKATASVGELAGLHKEAVRINKIEAEDGAESSTSNSCLRIRPQPPARHAPKPDFRKPL